MPSGPSNTQDLNLCKGLRRVWHFQKANMRAKASVTPSPRTTSRGKLPRLVSASTSMPRPAFQLDVARSELARGQFADGPVHMRAPFRKSSMRPGFSAAWGAPGAS